MRPSRATRKGNTLVLVLLLLPVLLAVSAMAINVAYLELTRTETQIAVDACTRAASMKYASTKNYDSALTAAKDMAARNLVAGRALPLGTQDLVLGTAYRPTSTGRYTFSQGGVTPNAVWLKSQSLANHVGGAIKPLFPVPTPYSFKPLREAISVRLEMDVALVIDRSGSMAFAADEVSGRSNPAAAPIGWTFGQPVPPNSRWLDLIAGVQAFFQVLNSSPVQERVSLTTYNHYSEDELTLTTDYNAIMSQLNAHSLAFQGGATNIGDGMEDGLHTLFDPFYARPSATKVLIVMTDGNHNCGKDPELAADDVKNSNLLAYTVTFSNEANKGRMDKVAKKTGGYNIHATNRAELVAAFEEIARALPALLVK